MWRWDSDPFGDGLAAGYVGGTGHGYAYDLRFPGQVFDINSGGFHLNWHREYDSLTGRYLQSDPIGLHGGANTYGYAASNPLSLIDPKGQNPAAAARAGWLFGRAANAGINAIIGGLTGTTLGGLIYEMCNDDPAEAACRKVLEGCREKCTDIYVDGPGSLPGTGSDMFGRLRRCIRECMEAQGCFNF